MKLVKSLSLLCVGLGCAGIMASQGCGSSDSGTSSGGGTAAAGRTPPAVPEGATPTTATDSRTFALNQLFLGETGRNGAALKDAWKDYGYNIDGKTTTKESKDVCQRQGGADSAKQEDGKEGIDNAFGRTVLGFILGLVPTPSKTLNDSIQSGGFTILLDVKGLTDSPEQTNTGLSGRLLVGGEFSDDKTKKPTFTPADDWPYRANPIVPIEGAYINNGVFVNGSSGAKVELSLFIQGVALSLVINRAAITFKHSAPDEITDGTISGVINTEDLVSGIEKVAGRISTQLCGGSTLDTIKQTIRQASDIRDDGTNAEGVPCNAISIGLGFTGKRIGEPKTVAKESAAPPDPCTESPDAGADAGQ
jgi:hypothetical protein